MTITVYSGSSGKVPDAYIGAAKELGRLMAQRGHRLVNGAGRTGLMAAAADACLAAGGEAIGVIPAFMIEQGWQHEAMTSLVVTPDMHRRKERMAELSEACIALPGGVGTLEELLEITTRHLSQTHCRAQHRRLLRPSSPSTRSGRRGTLHEAPAQGNMARGPHTGRSPRPGRGNTPLGCLRQKVRSRLIR